MQVDPELHQEVLDRSDALGVAPYGGFINPWMEATRDAEGKDLSC